MTFVDTNVFMYAVGRKHPLKESAQKFFEEIIQHNRIAETATSSEVLQELLHAYLPVDRLATLDAAYTLVDSCIGHIWSVDADDVRLAKDLVAQFPALTARDLLHLASCMRRGVKQIKTFDRTLATAFKAMK